MLYLIATPIGNLADITYRAVETLKECDYILCEDTRHSRRLLDHYHINRPLKSFHKFNETALEQEVLNDLKEEKKIALISDAGTPTISDPGYLLVKACIEAKLPVTSLPGACAALVALTLSGFNPLPFQFVGFLPKKKKELDAALNQILLYEGTSIAYESPNRLCSTLSALHTLAPNRTLCVARELTKFYEESRRGTPELLEQHYTAHPPKGECVLLFDQDQEVMNWSHLSLKEHVDLLFSQGSLSLHDAIKRVAQLRHLPKRTVYQAIHEKDG